MTKEYLENILTEYGVAFTDSLADRLLKEFKPCEDTVSRGVFEQIMWERDVAIEQLKELGYGLGQKVEPCEDAINRQAVLDEISDYNNDLDYTTNELYDRIKRMPPVNPQQKIGRCKECKWWRDSDGVFRRGVGAESQCPINKETIYEGNGYCYMFAPHSESEDEYADSN